MTEFSLASSTRTLWRLFEDRLYKIPNYQRGYAWEQPQLDDLLEDLELLLPGRHHYTGTVVLHRREDNPVRDKRGNSYEVFDVVDGQQRLTTIVVLLDAVRRELAGLAACRTWGYPAAWEGAGSSDSEPRWDQSGVLGQDGETEHRVEGGPAGVGLALQGRLSLLKAH